MAGLIVRLFGHPQMEQEGSPIAVDTRKAVALLAYLAVTGLGHSRDTLAALLWPEYDHSNARAALRRTLSSLNKAIGDQHLSSGWETIALNRSVPIWLDVLEFRACLAACAGHGHPASQVCLDCIAPLQKAVELCRGEFMEGFTLRDSAPFDEWQFLEAESLRREQSGALERLAAGLGQQGQVEPAIDTARRWLALDPLREEAHRQLMILYARAGQHGAALRQYRECVRVLDQELGVAPLEETTRLYQDIQERRSLPGTFKRPLPLVARVDREDLGQAEPATRAARLVGRAAEWTAMEAALQNGGHFFGLIGEAGVGKTWLAEAFAVHARARGAPVLYGRCYMGELDLAYSPFLDAIRSHLTQPAGLEALRDLPAAWLAETAWLLPELAALAPGTSAAGDRPNAEGPAAQSRFFEGLRQVLLALACGPSTGLLMLDDLHLADSATLDFLTYLVRRLAGQPLLVIGIWVDDGSAAAQRLSQLISESGRGGKGAQVNLRRFSPEEVAQMAAGQLPVALVERLQAEAEGLPFFVAEYLSAFKEGKLADAGGTWVLPHGVRDLLHARLAAVDETGLQLLATAAVIGRSFDFDSLQMASGRSEDEAITALEKLVARGLILEGRPETGSAVRYDFSHEKLRGLVYEETSLARRRLLHRRVAEALANQARDPLSSGMQASQIARHHQLAGQDEKAAEYYFTAGEYARRLHAHSEAIAHYQAALALGHPRVADLREAIGDLQTLQGNYAGALASYEGAAAQTCGDCIPRLEHKLGKVHVRRGAWEIAETHLLAALETLGEGGDPGLRSQIYADLSQAAAQRGQTERALSFARLARELAESAGDWPALAQSYNILGILARSEDQQEAARGYLEQSLQAAGRADEAGARMAALNNLALVYSDLGQYDEAIRLGQQALELCVQLGDRHREAALRDHLAEFYHLLGQAQPAMEQLEKAVKIFAEIGVEDGQSRPEIWKLSEW